MKQVLLINPPIYDFTAHDLWSKPLGLLYLASILKEQNINIQFLDYCNREFKIYKNHNIQNTQYGCGHYLKQSVQKPTIFKNIPRKYSRYGITESMAEQILKTYKKPDMIIITSIMTYWYLGVFEVINTLETIFPNTPIIIGGVYASLCSNHFKEQIQNIKKHHFENVSYETLDNNAISKHYSNDKIQVNSDKFHLFNNELNSEIEHCQNIYIVKGSIHNLNPLFIKFNIPAQIPNSFQKYPAPDYSVYLNSNVSYETLPYIAIRMSLGCPFNCSYCAQNILCDNQYIAKNPLQVFDEIAFFTKRGIKNIVFYDDALLYQSEIRIKPLLRKIISAEFKCNFHTPNGLHIKYLDLELAQLMKKVGFIMPRFSLETINANLQKSTGNKIDNQNFEIAIDYLKKAGFEKGQFMIYLLMGMPNQDLYDVQQSIEYVHNLGGKISLSEYSVIPHTADFKNLDKKFLDEPLYHNKSVYPLFNNQHWAKIYELKLLAKHLNSLL
jgi:radical SAM superfamily enzyme YgiQ (UPF0313 family)